MYIMGEHYEYLKITEELSCSLSFLIGTLIYMIETITAFFAENRLKFYFIHHDSSNGIQFGINLKKIDINLMNYIMRLKCNFCLSISCCFFMC